MFVWALQEDPKELRLKVVASKLETDVQEGLLELQRARDDGCPAPPATQR